MFKNLLEKAGLLERKEPWQKYESLNGGRLLSYEAHDEEAVRGIIQQLYQELEGGALSEKDLDSVLKTGGILKPGKGAFGIAYNKLKGQINVSVLEEGYNNEEYKGEMEQKIERALENAIAALPRQAE